MEEFFINGTVEKDYFSDVRIAIKKYCVDFSYVDFVTQFF